MIEAAPPGATGDDGGDPHVPLGDDHVPLGDDHVPLGDDIAELIAEAKRAATAEVAFQAQRAKLAAGAIARIVAYAALALALLFFVLMAVIVGLLLGLTAVVGPWGAMAIVVGGLVLATALAGVGAWAGWTRLRWLIAGGDAP